MRCRAQRDDVVGEMKCEERRCAKRVEELREMMNMMF